MLRLFSRRVVLAVVVVLLVFFSLMYLMPGVTNSTARVPATDDPWPGTGAWAKRVLQELTLKRKVAQLFSARAYGRFKSKDDPDYQRLVDLVERFGVGGLAFFQSNPMAQAALLNDLQKRADVPLLISQDMEWGAGMRIRQTTTFPRAMALGATRNPDYARAAGYVTAREARALGTQQVYAPVADVNNNPHNPIINVRSFSERPGLVAEMVTASVHGLQEGRAIATAKHFPGHGDTSTDSHLGLPVLSIGRPRLQNVELVPFQAALQAGVKSVMVGHLAVPALESDSTVPASLSPRITQDLLREQLGYEGLVVTDALDMRGVTDNFGAGKTAVRALEAGVDVLLISKDAYAARQAILRAVENGRLSEDRIDASVMRILRAKEWAGLHEERTVDLDAARRRVATQPHLALSHTIARKALTLLRNEDDLLPLLDTEQRLLSITLNDGDDADAGDFFTRQLRRHTDALTTRLLDARSDDADYDAALQAARQHDVVVVPAFLRVRSWSGNIALSKEHQTFLNELIGTGTPVVLLAFGNPYMVVGLDNPAAYVAAYGSSHATQTAAAGALFGKSGFSGQLPITIPDRYDYGAGLQTEQVAPREGYPEEVGMVGDTLRRVDSLMRASIDQQSFPSAAVAIGRDGVVVKKQGYGYYTYDAQTPVTPRSVFDIASLTKIIATTTTAMLLYEQDVLDLDARVVDYLPAFGNHGKQEVTIRQLLSHTSGLPAYRPFHQEGFSTREEVIDAIMNAELEFEPGAKSQYSDFGMITLYLVLDTLTEPDYATFAQEHIFEPLRMNDTGFRATGATDTTVVPTEIDESFRERLVQGEVHDETAWLLGGVSGHAGLFSTADDLAKFAYMVVNGGDIYGQSFLEEETLELFTTPASDETTRALGWDTKSDSGYSSAGDLFSPDSFGHTGFTGTSLWIDPEAKLFAILLTNRVYPTRENRDIIQIRPTFADLAHAAIQGPPELLLPLPSDE